MNGRRSHVMLWCWGKNWGAVRWKLNKYGRYSSVPELPLLVAFRVQSAEVDEGGLVSEIAKEKSILVSYRVLRTSYRTHMSQGLGLWTLDHTYLK